ncbi:potassium voltage-gated channel subfamily V member 1 [Neolamprologus brichardi]|uniref:potassium voltage-gated channel subfamily V member 1 n=1 Tax=Neolamprologus brichardi TaxID=32507 RepID=UPI001643D7AB|nr:potassium voltage-gated channel subfamily V member 1 [Neolamprologus brichardi]
MSVFSSSMAGLGSEVCGDTASLVSLESSVFLSERTASCVSDTLIIINVGGSRYVLSQDLLASYPETRLGKLACCSRDSALELCDDVQTELTCVFVHRYVMNYYRTGHLHVMEELCEISFLQEIEYWGIDELRINPCCRERYYRRKEQKESLEVQRELDADDGDEDFAGVACPGTRRRLWDVLEKPESSRAARTFGSLSMFFVVLSVINMVLISLDLGEDFGGLKSLGMTIAQCYEEVGLLLLFLGVGISIFAAAVFALEHDLPATTFTSVPAAWWWATTSMTTVGYGDVRPDTAVGKVLAFLCILSGILILALPIAIINDRFSACYFTLKTKEAAIRHGEMLKRLARGSVGEAGPGVNLRDAYARSVLEMMRLQGRERASTRSSGGDELWW